MKYPRHLVLACTVFLGLVPFAVLAATLLANGRFESFQSYNGKTWRGFPESYGQDWTVQVIDEDGLHFMDSDTFGQFVAAVYGVPYLNYKLEGNYSQAFASRHYYDFVFSQTVAVATGQDYALGGKIVTFYKGSGPPVDHTKILKRVGIDPTGGQDYNSANVVWTDWDGTDNAWTSPAIATTAQAGQMTVFLQIDNTVDDVGAAYLNVGYVDNFKFELAPVATLNLPDQAVPGTVDVTWDVTIADSFWNLWGYDVQYKEDNGNWQIIQTHDGSNGTDTSYTLNAQAGKTYTFRVRPWQQEAPNGSPVTTALPGVWVEKSVSVGQAVVGRIIKYNGAGLAGVTVSVSGTSTSTASLSGGSYSLATGPGTFDVVAADFNELAAPPATAITVPAEGVGSLTLTLCPTGTAQVLANNHFESDLSDWRVSDGAAVGVSHADYHTGVGSLQLSNTVTVSQTGHVTAMSNPLLSFWYKSDAALTVELLAEGGSGVSPAQTQLLAPANDWTHHTLDMALDDVYTGTVGVNFSRTGAGVNIFVDEVCLAAGPRFKVYLPAIIKE